MFAGEGRVRVDDVPEPRLLEDDDVIVRVTRTAVCGSDLHLLHGKTPGGRVGGIIGHEFTGIVEEAGTAVTSVSPGQRVLGSFLIACGFCHQCRKGRYNYCTSRRALGLGELTGDLDGAQAELVRVPGANLNVRSLDGSPLTDEQAVFGGDILATAFYAANMLEVQGGELVAVVGAGPVGLLCAAACRARGARVLVLDTDGARVEFARTHLGMDAEDVSSTAPYVFVADRTGGDMADIAIDAVGVVPAFKGAMRCVKEGGRVGIVGVYGPERYDLPMGMVWVRGLDLRFAGMANVQGHWDEALDAVAGGDVDPTALISHTLPLDEAERGYELFESREAMKVVLVP